MATSPRLKASGSLSPPLTPPPLLKPSDIATAESTYPLLLVPSPVQPAALDSFLDYTALSSILGLCVLDMARNKQSKGAGNSHAEKPKKDNGLKDSAAPEAAVGDEGNPPSTDGWGAASVGSDTRPRDHGLKEPPSPTRSAKWPDFQTSDLEVMVAGSMVFRLHQEIMAAHSRFFREQLQVTVDSEGLVVAPRSNDVPVVVLRDICVDAFTDVVSLIYPRPGFDSRRAFTTLRAEELLQTAHALGMPGIVRIAVDMLASDPKSTSISLYLLGKQYGITDLQIKSFQELVYRTRPLSDEEALAIGATTTAQIARLREFWRAGIFARFEPVQSSGLGETKSHRSGEDSEFVQWSDSRTSAAARPELGRCQQAMLDALKIVFKVDGPRSQLERYIIREESSIMRNLAEWLRLEGLAGGTTLCNGCMGSIDRAVRVYCRVDEMNVRIEREVGSTPEPGEQPFFDC